MKYYDQLLEQMTSYYTNLVACAPDQASDVMIRLRVLAAQLDTYCQQAEQTAGQAFFDTATGEALERHAALRGLTRKEGSKATGLVVFQRSTPAGYQILIPAGTLVQSGGAEAMTFATVQDVVMGGTLISAIASVQAVEPGSRYNLQNGSITVMVTPPPGISQVYQLTACQGGSDPETDEELRARLLAACRDPSVGGSPGWYQAQALAQPGVGKAKVLPVHRGGGTLDLVVYGSAGEVSDSQLAAIQGLFSDRRELGIDILTRKAAEVPVDLDIKVEPEEGWDYNGVCAACEEALQKALAALDIGEGWPVARICQVVMSQRGVKNCAVVAPAADLAPQEDRLLIFGSINFERMGVAA